MTATLSPDVLDHGQVTANLYLEGLAIMHFDHQVTTWEIDFLRNAKHTLLLSIEGNGHSGDPVVIDPSSPHDIEIIVEDGIAPDWAQFPNGYWFSNETFNRRADLGHPEDFRWVTDLANQSEFLLHGLVRKRTGTLGPSLTSISKVTVKDVIFYTKGKTEYVLTQALLGIPNQLPYGKTNTVVGADIVCADTGVVVIKIDGQVYQRLPHVPNSPYKISLENSESRSSILPQERILGDFLVGDFFLFYDFLDVLGLTYDMVCPLSLLHSDDCDCNVGFVSSFFNGA